ncbi:hemoglobin subunit alpha-2-like [Opisthocomus hoazin]|uniref:hemoglobin subunit alpha-2-like n=1 Tax=Opisthocomus hoazin TaxID=30419 RepID=UPI003F52D123
MLTAEEKQLLHSVWEKVAPHTDDFGAETLERMFCTFPQTKTYFPHFDLHHGSEQVRCHGKKVLTALGNGIKNLDNLSQALSELSNLHAYNLRVDPANFKLLAHCFQVVLAAHLCKDYTPELHAAMDKFLSAVAAVLSEKYR